MMIGLSSCTRAYYLNPFNANSQNHHAIPLQSDTFRTATYVNCNLSVGGANDVLRDETIIFNTAVYRSHTFEMFNLYYGADLSLGNYNVMPYKGKGNGMDTAIINRLAGNKFTGSYGIDAGVNVVLPFAGGGEWRIVGLEACVRNEFGDYLQFRERLPFEAANVIDRNHVLVTLGLATDIIFRVKHHSSMGLKFALGKSIFMDKAQWAGTYISQSYSRGDLYTPGYGYFTQTTHFTIKRYTGFLQSNIGTQAFSFQMGMSYRL
jgi:hypothetical protein